MPSRAQSGDDLRALGSLSVALTGGEALLHPQFLAIARAARDRSLAVRIEPGLAGRMEYIGTLMVKEGEAWRPVYLEGPGPRLRPLQ